MLQETSANNWRTFKPQTSLKPTYLEKEATHLEAVQFTRSFQNYILDGYGGNPPENAVWIQLQPLMNPLWMESMIQKDDIKKKNLEGIVNLILKESSGRNPLHQRRIELLRVKKTGSHSDFFLQLEQHISLIEINKLIKEALLINLFLEQSDETMGNVPGNPC